MQQYVSPPSPARRRLRVRPRTFVAAGILLAAILATVVALMIQAAFAAAVVPLRPSGDGIVGESAGDGSLGSAAPGQVPSLAVAPTADDGVIPEGSVVRLSDVDVAAIARLDPALREAMLEAESDAAADGISFQVTSGWRSETYQRWLLDDAVRRYGSEEIARQYVATPELSSHVTGHAVDIGPLDAQTWLIEHGTDYGICQTYANERWHFELATTPGGVCPEMKTDARG